MSSIFSRIYRGEIPGHFIDRNDEFFAILDINPLAIGHVLVIPVQEVDYVFDLEDEVLSRYMVYTKRIAKAIKKVVDCQRIGMSVVGLEVPHSHIHLIPINNVDDMNFSSAKLSPSQDDLKSIADQIANEFI